VRPSVLWILLLAFLLLPSTAALAVGTPQPQAPSEDIQEPGVVFPNEMKVGVYVLSVSNFDFAVGTYSMDMFITFGWTNHSIDRPHFEIMNGKPSYSTAIEKIGENKTGDFWTMRFRARLDLFVTPTYEAYPFDSENLQVIIEESYWPLKELVYTWWPEQSDVDGMFSITGWRVNGFLNDTWYKDYPNGDAFARLSVGVNVVRDSATGVVQSLLPPLIFCIVSGLAYLFTENKDGTIALRLGLGTSMLITAVMFYFSQMSTLPPGNQLKLLDIYMLAVYLFLALSLVVTALIYHNVAVKKMPERIPYLNKMGFIITTTLSVGVFFLLLLVNI
jgi:hypothetical protein